jgi:DNA polymerase-4
LRGKDLHPHLHEQALRVASRLRRAGLRARSVHLKVKFADFRIVTRQETLAEPTDDGAEIYSVARRLLGKVDDRPARLTGVHAGDLGALPQLGLFDGARPAARKRAQLNASLDRIAERFGSGAVVPADLLARKK